MRASGPGVLGCLGRVLEGLGGSWRVLEVSLGLEARLSSFVSVLSVCLFAALTLVRPVWVCAGRHVHYWWEDAWLCMAMVGYGTSKYMGKG